MLSPKVTRIILAGIFLSLVLFVNFLTIHVVFEGRWQAHMISVLLFIQTLLIVPYHLRCLEYGKAIDIAGKEIKLYYLLFAAVSFCGILFISLHTEKDIVNWQIKYFFALNYGVLILMGTLIAFKSLIGIKNITDHEVQHTETPEEPEHQHDTNSDPEPDPDPEPLDEEISVDEEPGVDDSISQNQKKLADGRVVDIKTGQPPQIPDNVQGQPAEKKTDQESAEEFCHERETSAFKQLNNMLKSDR